MTHTVVLVGCGSAKRDRYCAAKDLYTSTYFQKKRAYAEQYGDQWFILSAKHKLFDPDRWLAPYDKSMADVADPGQWARFVGGELHHQCNDITEDVEVVVLAGRDYSDPLRSVLEELNFVYRCPFDATSGIGEQLAWLTDRLDAASDQERVMTDGGQDVKKRRENQELVTATRRGNEIHIELNDAEFDVDEYPDLLQQIKRTAWLAADEDKLDRESAVHSIGNTFVGDGNCHECGYEGKIVENEIGTTYCPKCRSTNVGWPA